MASTQKKRPTRDELKGMLLEGDFGSSKTESLPLSDPISTTQVVLKLHEIKAYDKNPRREPNPAYEDIKASIRSKKQLNNNFNVTRRPGDDLFMVESGGNTRLNILKELYRETGDEAFNTVHCLYIPWRSEASVLTAHLIENEMRGDMFLIDKAYAVQELKQELETEPLTPLSDIAFTRLAAQLGYKISPKQLRRFNYALKLDQMIPQVLRKGVGGNKVEYIKKVETAYRDYCQDKTEQFDVAFMAVMAESDTDEPSWDFERVRQDLDERLAELTGVRVNLLRIEVDARLFNSSSNDLNPVDRGDQAAESHAPLAEPDEIALALLTTPSEGAQSQFENQDQDQDPETVLEKSDEDKSETKMTETTAGNSGENSLNHSTDSSTELKILRQKSLDLACNIARSAGLEALVMPTQCGLGYFMEAPDQPFPDARSYYHWWLLFGISEQNVKAESHFPMWQHSVLYHRLDEAQRNQDDSLLHLIGPDPGAMTLMFELLHNRALVNDQHFTESFRLMENCRRIRCQFTELEIWAQAR